MSNRLISILGGCCAFLAVVYLGLIAVTVSFATWQTDLAHDIRATEQEIAELEAAYFSSISAINRMNPGDAGLVAPASVAYVTEVARPGLSRADR